MAGKSCSKNTPALLSPWRRRCQWGTSLLLLLTPWFNSGGKSLLRLDIPGLKLYFFGQTLRIEELYLLLLAGLTLTLGFLLVTMLLGRVWCGWFCPQTTLTDLTDWAAARLGLKGKRAQQAGTGQKVLLQLFNLCLAMLVSANLLWYFIEPHSFFHKLISAELHYAAVIFLLVVASIIYIDLAVIRRLMCSDFCPYGRFQATLADQSTLTLHLPSAELPRCIKCDSCVRVCPMQIDIRQGDQVECINCGRCLDACRLVMAKRKQPGLISYSFGTRGAGAKALLNLRTLLLSLATLALLVILLFAIDQRPPASLKIEVSHTAASRTLEDGTLATFFNAFVNNRSDQKATWHLAARQAGDGKPLLLKGRTSQLELEPGENLRIDFVLITPVTKSRLEIEFILAEETGAALVVTKAQVRGTEGVTE